jgi:outer membrane lipoprotein SlyB
MFRTVTLALTGLFVAALASGCTRSYSPNTYSAAAAQQANKVTQGVVVGYREVLISPDGTVGAVSGGAAGGVLGAQTPGSGVATALGTIGGTLLGSLVGTGIEKASGDTRAFEYLIRQTDGSLISVTQKDEEPLPVGEKVLVIAGNQARVVRDYSQPVPEGAPASAAKPPSEAPPPPAPSAIAPAPSRPAEIPAAAASAAPEPPSAAPAETAPEAVGPPIRLTPPDSDEAPAAEPMPPVQPG